ncbi:MAG TPA: large conductance mechanosensitive channel protein MscL [Rhizomicrobium sp.]|nr:large conductance mechanosensitive channel protein MscL [Rhizomicrobium sp.]
MLEEFRKFVMRGNVIDLAVGVVVDASFTAIVNSLVKDVLMPPIGLILGGIDFSDFFITLKGDHGISSLAAAQKAGLVTLNYGLFINTIINFLIIAFVLFLIIRAINRLQTRKDVPAAVPEEVQLLREIRDSLKVRNP